uniref:Uncharacterized protein n=1 Tax=Melanopsichium pennsylvanicum 4 TaxID=1398559 RepID=A0A077R4V6_9BASI|nr:conserved hypothetical protein [Melanopsichium pennsylvanicum 4]
MSALGTVGLFYYFQGYKIRDVAKSEAASSRQSETNPSGTGCATRTATAKDPNIPSIRTKLPSQTSKYHNEPEHTENLENRPTGGLASYLDAPLSKKYRDDLDNMPVRAEEDVIGRTIKQAARIDRKRKDGDCEDRFKQQQHDVVKGRKEREVGDEPARKKNHLSDVHGRKCTM